MTGFIATLVHNDLYNMVPKTVIVYTSANPHFDFCDGPPLLYSVRLGVLDG